MDLSNAAQYPYTDQARQYVHDLGITVEDLLGGASFRPARQRGMERVIAAIIDGEVPNRESDTDQERVLEILSYIYARILVSGIDDSYLTRRYALAEAVLANRRLQVETGENVVKIAKELGMLVLVDNDGVFHLHFSDFLQYSTSLQARSWKLFNQDLNNGWVRIEKRRIARLIQAYVRKKLLNDLPLTLPADIKSSIENMVNAIDEALEERKGEASAVGMEEFVLEAFPPCMKHIAGMAQAGENLSHEARFALTAFLHHAGMSNDEIVDLFSGSPDFNERKTRYQVDHITGVRSTKEYMVPDCTTMKSYGNCYNADELCDQEWMSNPLSYYRIVRKRISD